MLKAATIRLASNSISFSLNMSNLKVRFCFILSLYFWGIALYNKVTHEFLQIIIMSCSYLTDSA